MNNYKNTAAAKVTVTDRVAITENKPWCSQAFSIFSFLMLSAMLMISSAPEARAANAGYSEYFIPGNEDTMQLIIEEIGSGTQGTTTHSTIGVTSWDGNTTLYYDHWENGYNLDPNNLEATYDEKVILAEQGDSQTFESGNITTPQAAASPGAVCGTGVTCVYDGRDRIITVGGAVTVSRSSWIESNDDFFGPYLAVAWEVYPRSPLLTTYIMPFGEDLAPTLDDFDRVYALIQATEDSTTLSVDYDGISGADRLCERDGTTELSSYTLSQGDVFLLDEVSACDVTSLDTGTRIDANAPVQVQYIIGDEGSSYEIRGLSAFPRGFWSKEYYAPAPGHTNGGGTDIFLYNPHSAPLQINWETASANGSISVPQNSTVSLSAAAGGISVPNGSAVYLNAADEFWGISTIDSEGVDYDWAYSLVPVELLTDESFLAWAPGSEPTGTGGDADNSGLFITPAQDAITVFIDTDGDGSADQTYNLDRLQTQYVFDPVDGDMSDAHIWATGPYAAAYGQNPDLAPSGTPAIDVGYTLLPSIETEPVLTIDKTTNPTVVSVASGSQADYTLTIRSYDYEVDNINVDDFLPAGWRYVSGSTTITRADLTNLSGASADPAGAITYFDSFPGQVYSSNTENSPVGTNWVNNWIEENDDGSAATGSIQAVSDSGTSAIRLGESNDTNRYIARIADLSGSSNATFSFNYRRDGMEDTDFLRAYVCSDANDVDPVTCNDSGGWTSVVTITDGTDTNYQNFSIDLSSIGIDSNSSAFAVRFETDDLESDLIYVTNVSLATSSEWTDAQLLSLAANQTITIEFTAETTQDFNIGDVTRNEAEATGTRTVEGVVQTFTASDFVFNSFGDLQITKTSSVDAATPLSPGDTYTYTVVVNNPVGSPTYNNVAIYDSLPPGVSYVTGTSEITAPAGLTTEDVLDQFSTQAYNNNDGSVNWTGSWTESGTGDNSPAAGEIQITGGQLQIGNDAAAGSEISRAMDLSGYTSATLSYEFDQSGPIWNGGGYDNVVVTISNGSTTQQVEDHDYAGPGTISFTIPDAYRTSGFFVSLEVGENIDGDEYRTFDDFRIEVTSPGSGSSTSPANNPPNFVTTSDGYDLDAGESMTLTFDVTVDNPLANGINEITNVASATADELPVPISDSVTNIVNNPGAGSATVGQRVWFDTDGNGVDNVGEPGLANVEVTLRDDFGTPIAVTTTDSNGYYSFTGIPAGSNYYVQVTDGLDSGLTLTTTAGPVSNSTPRFDLTEGQNYTDANLGYEAAAGTATIGDLVWSDADGNGSRDAGEPGLSGVTVELWLDVNQNGIFEPGTDTLESTTTSGADGSYIFSGVPATGTEDYFVYVDATQGVTSGYTSTTSTNFLISDVSSGDVQLNADFGFQPSGGGGTTGYTISDRIWFDVNADGDDESGGESGLGGVTVNLLNASGVVIATTITDATGAFTFSGVPDGNYTLDVTDTGNVLVDYYGTTASAISGSKAVTVSGASVTGVNFGYNVTRSIGDTVFNDLDGDGTQDAGEPGISGVVVELDDGSCTPGSTCPVVTTDANGKYLFSGLSDGSYTVLIDATQSSLSGFSLTTADDDAAGSPHTRDVVLTGGASVLDIDYGYQAGGGSTNSIDGTLWSDENQDGVIDGSEALLENVIVELVNSGGTVLATTTTDANGDYSFTGWPNADYTVRVTDTGSILNGYTQTYEVDAGLCSGSSCDGSSAADTTSGPVSGLNFGYYIEIIPTLVSLTDFQAYQTAEGVVVEWQTGSEQGTAGFWLERKVEGKKGKFIRVNDELMPSLSLQGQLQGGTYQYVDTGAKAGSKYRYRLIEEEVWGTSKTYGPFRVQVTETRQDDAEPNAKGRKKTQLSKTNAVQFEEFRQAGKNFKQKARKLQRKIDRKAMKEARKLARKANKSSRRASRYFEGVTLTVRNAGLIHVDAEQLATEMGLELEAMQKLIAKGMLKLTNRGKTVRWQAAEDNTGLSFYGEAIDSLYTLDNVYQLRIDTGKGKKNQIASKKAAPSKRGVDIDSFLHTEVVEKNAFPSLSTIKNPEIDYWYEGFVLAGHSVFSSQSFDLPLDNVLNGYELVVDLLGANEKQHEVDVLLNGQLLGSGSWSGIGVYTLTLPLSGQLNASGSNTLELVSGGESGNFIYYNRSIVSYERATHAVNNQLLVTAPRNGNVTIDGFTDVNIRVWDITNPLKPVTLVKAENGSDSTGAFMVRFFASDGHTYLAVADSAKITVTAEALQPTDWSRGAEHLVISTADLENSAQALVNYRNSSGIPSQLILVEDIYHRYNYGIANPFAIRTFLEKFAKPRGARYIVLAGSASYDYRNLMEVGDNFVPTLFTSTPHGLFSCDSCLGDINNDNYPEFIISRIPATDDVGLFSYVEKLRAYESLSASSSALLLADKNDPRAGDFKVDSENLVGLFPNYFQVKRVYLDDYTDSNDVTDIGSARTAIFNAIDAGVGHINYLGHGGVSQFSSGLLTSSDLGSMSNAMTPVVSALTCSVNYYEIPGFAALGEELVMDTNGGAVAVWGPSGLSYNGPAVAMNKKLLETLYQSGQSRLGDAIEEVRNNTPNVPGYMLRIYNLLGDAAVQVH